MAKEWEGLGGRSIGGAEVLCIFSLSASDTSDESRKLVCPSRMGDCGVTVHAVPRPIDARKDNSAIAGVVRLAPTIISFNRCSSAAVGARVAQANGISAVIVNERIKPGGVHASRAQLVQQRRQGLCDSR